MRRPWTLTLLCLFFVNLIISGPSFAQNSTQENRYKLAAEKTVQFQGFWRLSLLGDQATDDLDGQHTQTTLNARMDLNFIFSSYFKMNLVPSAKFRSGYLQIDQNAQLDNSNFDLKNASADLHVGDSLQFSAGSLNQEPMHSKLLISDRAFPAARIQVGSDSKNLISAGVIGQAAVPTATAFSTNSAEKESTPSFNSTGVFARVNSSSFNLRLALATFQFKNLPISVSTKAGLVGNDVILINATDSGFKYEFQGGELRADLDWKLSQSLSYQLEGSAIENNSAPANLNQAYWVKNKLPIQFNDNWALIPSYEFFRIEPDAVVSVYNEESFNANRSGYNIGLGLQWKKALRVSIKGGTRVAVYEKITQPQEETVGIMMEALDVNF